MLSQILHHKISNIIEPKDREIISSLKHILQEPVETPEEWRSRAASMFTQMMARIAMEEGVSPYEDDENPFKHHLPNFISTTLSEIEKIVFSPLDANVEPDELRYTLTHLLLKVAEWIAWNYEGRCLFGEDSDRKASELEKMTRFQIELWGDKDEVWLYLMDLLRDEWGLGNKIHFMEPLFGCRRYGLLIPFDANRYLANPSYWETVPPEKEITLITTMTTILTDQTRVSLEFLGRTLKGERAKSTGICEGLMLSQLAKICGTPTEELPHQ